MIFSPINSLISIAEKLGIAARVCSKVSDSSISQPNKSITIYNDERRIFGSFYYYNYEDNSHQKIMFGPLLTAEIDFGLEAAKASIQEFRKILSSFFILINHSSPSNFIENDLNIDAYYEKNTFTYNTIEEIDEFYKLELLLFSHIKDRNKLAAISTLHLFIKHYYKYVTKSELQCFYISLITLLARVEIEKGNPVNIIFEKQFQYYHYLDEVIDIKTFESIMKSAIDDFLENYNSIPKVEYNPLIVSVLNYVENNIYENLTLSQICSSLQKDPKYIGKLFYKETGIYFKDYYLLKKIDKAKYFLLFSNKTINEISEDLSFSSQSHFTSSFKKVVGTTPYKYKSNRVYYSY